LTSPDLFTSYWNNRDLPRVDAVKVSISRGDGRGVRFRYRKAWPLAPSRETFALRGGEAFDKSYLRQLDSEGVGKIRDLLTKISDGEGGRDLILLCHEKNPPDCHRSLFSAWWESKTGQEVPELGGSQETLW
jgi:hypothetical protein